MDAAYRLMKPCNFFVGKSETADADEDLKNSRLHRGISISAIAKQASSKRRKNTQEKSRAGPLPFKFGAPFSSTLWHRYVKGTGRMTWKDDEILEILGYFKVSLRKIVDQYEDDGASPTSADDEDDKEKEQSSKSDPSETRSKRKVSDLFTPDILTVLIALTLNDEVNEMAFPYLRLHRDCWKILRDVRDACLPILADNKHMPTPLSLPDADKTDKCPYLVVEDIFAAASTSACGPPDMRPMEAAAKVINAYLGGDEGNGVGALRAMEAMGFQWDAESTVDEEDEDADADSDNNETEGSTTATSGTD